MIYLLCESDGISEAVGSEIWAAIISAVVSILIGIISGLLTARKAKMNFYSSTVSKERVDWINKTREITSKLVAFCAAHPEDELSMDDMYTFEELRCALFLRISPKEFVEEKNKYRDTDGALIDILDQDKYSDIRDSKKEIRRIITIICKNEWNRIKAEAGGSKNVEKLIRKYDSTVDDVK